MTYPLPPPPPNNRNKIRNGLVATLIIVIIIISVYFAYNQINQPTQPILTPTPTPTATQTPTTTSTASPTPLPTATQTPTNFPIQSPTVNPTPNPTTTQSPMILSHTGYNDNSGYYKIVGEVKNTLNTNIRFVEVIATFYDSENIVIGTDYTFTYIDILVPNQKSPFEISSYPDKITPASYKLTIDYLTTTQQPLAGLTILSHSASYDTSGYHKIVGEVKNNGASTAEFVEVISTYYDSTGKVIATSYTFTDPSDINKGDAAPFEIKSFPRKITPASYELQVQGQ